MNTAFWLLSGRNRCFESALSGLADKAEHRIPGLLLLVLGINGGFAVVLLRAIIAKLAVVAAFYHKIAGAGRQIGLGGSNFGRGADTVLAARNRDHGQLGLRKIVSFVGVGGQQDQAGKESWLFLGGFGGHGTAQGMAAQIPSEPGFGLGNCQCGIGVKDRQIQEGFGNHHPEAFFGQRG